MKPQRCAALDVSRIELSILYMLTEEIHEIQLDLMVLQICME